MATTNALAQPLIQPVAQMDQHPYPPSWLDRFTAWLDRLPCPRWLAYTGLWLAIFLPYTALKWWDGAYPVGSFNGFHVLITSTGIYLLALMHYLDRMAGEALGAFRPVLTVTEPAYQQLHYRLTTLPGRRTLLVSLIAGLWLGPTFLYNRPLFPQLKMGTSTLTLSVEVLLFCLIWGLAATFVYHTIHQLRVVSHIYTHCTRINLFQLGPLYAFSRLTARTAIGVTIINYVWALPQTATELPAADASTTTFFSIIALVAFLWPLRGAHHVLYNEKQRLQNETSQRLANAFAELDRRVDACELGDVGTLKTAIDSLRTKQEVVAKISTWPWQIETVRGVIAAMSLPLLTWMAQRGLDLLMFVR